MSTRAGAIDLDELLDPERFAPHRLAQLDVAALRVALEARRRGLRTVLSGPTFAHLRPTWSADVAAIEAEMRRRGVEPAADEGRSA